LKGVTLEENHVIFDLDTTVLFSRVIEGPYPDFWQVIPKHNEKRFVVSRDVLIPAVKRVSILSNSQTHQVRLVWEKETLELSAVSQEIGGEARESIRTQHSDESFRVGYNANYLLEILRKMEPGDVVFELDTPATSGVIRPAEQPEGQDYLCLLMPLRLNGPGESD
jgi:DNA polymerase-3 subunit beta